MNSIQSICLGALVAQIIFFAQAGIVLEKSTRYISMGWAVAGMGLLIWVFRNRDFLKTIHSFFLGAGLSAIPVFWLMQINEFDPV